jgi:flavin-dependent dehydrogenase
VRARDASAYFEARLIGDGFIKVGEAAMAADPLSSSGIQLAIQSGIAASAIVNTLLRRPSSSEIAERFYGSRKARRMTDRSVGGGDLLGISAGLRHALLASKVGRARAASLRAQGLWTAAIAPLKSLHVWATAEDCSSRCAAKVSIT